MKKLIISFFLLLVFNTIQAQDSQPITVEGDLNKDGITDKVVFDPRINIDENFAIYFGDGHGGYTLFRSYDVGLYYNPQISITDKGVMRIQEGLVGNCDVFLFRYQEGDFCCIGGKEDRHDTFHYDVSYNFLTGKQIRADGEGKNKKSTTSTMSPMPVLRFGWFPLDFEVLGYLFEDGEWDNDEDLLEYKTVTGIYRLLQEKGLVSASFIEFHDLSGSAESVWSTYNEIMKYGCYNYSSSLSIDKQNDGSYWIHFMDEYEDRTYEQYIDEFDGDIDKAFEKAEKENGGEPSYKKFDEEWVFRDGKFTKVNDFEDQQEFETVRHLFQLLPDNDILDVDESNPYNAYREDLPWHYDAEEGWSTGYEIMRQGDFFILSTMKIKKLDDGSYRFLSQYSLEDQYYMRFLDDDMENMEEAKKKALKEKGSDTSFYSETEWLYKDGQFSLVRKERVK